MHEFLRKAFFEKKEPSVISQDARSSGINIGGTLKRERLIQANNKFIEYINERNDNDEMKKYYLRTLGDINENDDENMLTNRTVNENEPQIITGLQT